MAFSIVQFDGTNDYLLKSSVMTGIADGKEFSCVARFSKNADGSFQDIIHVEDGGSQRIIVQIASSNRLDVQLRNSIGTVIFRWLSHSSETITIADGEITIYVSCNLLTGAAELYFDDTASISSPSPVTNDTIDYTGANDWGICADGDDGSEKFDADVSFIWLDTTFIDFSVQANRDDFDTPSTLGSTGQNPTGADPEIYFTGIASVWNAGTNLAGDDFTMNGAVTDVGGGSNGGMMTALLGVG